MELRLRARPDLERHSDQVGVRSAGSPNTPGTRSASPIPAHDIIYRESNPVKMLNGRRLVRETRGGEPYEYYALGEYVVVAPGVCGGRPTFKGTRLEVQVILDLIAADWSQERILQEYRDSGITAPAIAEVVRLAADALRSTVETVPA